MSQGSPKKAKKSCEVTVTYWAGRGLCEPLRVILAAGGCAFKNNFLSTKEDMLALRKEGKLSFDQVPLVEIDGLNLVQSIPTALYLGQKFGLLPEDPKDQFYVTHVFTSVMDARRPLVAFPFNGQDSAKTCEELNGEKALFGRYAPKWEAMLGKTGGELFLEQPSIADCAVFEVMEFYAQVFGKIAMEKAFAVYPRLVALHSKVLKLGKVKEWCCEEQPKVFLPFEDYRAAVNKVLE